MSVPDRYRDRAQPDLQFLVDQRPALGAHSLQLGEQLLRLVIVLRVNGFSSSRASISAASGAGRAASSTRPMEVAKAGKRVPTLIDTVMIRRVGTLAT